MGTGHKCNHCCGCVTTRKISPNGKIVWSRDMGGDTSSMDVDKDVIVASNADTISFHRQKINLSASGEDNVVLLPVLDFLRNDSNLGILGQFGQYVEEYPDGENEWFYSNGGETPFNISDVKYRDVTSVYASSINIGGIDYYYAKQGTDFLQKDPYSYTRPDLVFSSNNKVLTSGDWFYTMNQGKLIALESGNIRFISSLANSQRELEVIQEGIYIGNKNSFRDSVYFEYSSGEYVNRITRWIKNNYGCTYTGKYMRFDFINEDANISRDTSYVSDDMLMYSWSGNKKFSDLSLDTSTFGQVEGVPNPRFYFDGTSCISIETSGVNCRVGINGAYYEQSGIPGFVDGAVKVPKPIQIISLQSGCLIDQYYFTSQGFDDVNDEVLHDINYVEKKLSKQKLTDGFYRINHLSDEYGRLKFDYSNINTGRVVDSGKYLYTLSDSNNISADGVRSLSNYRYYTGQHSGTYSITADEYYVVTTVTTIYDLNLDVNYTAFQRHQPNTYCLTNKIITDVQGGFNGDPLTTRFSGYYDGDLRDCQGNVVDNIFIDHSPIDMGELTTQGSVIISDTRLPDSALLAKTVPSNIQYYLHDTLASITFSSGNSTTICEFEIGPNAGQNPPHCPGYEYTSETIDCGEILYKIAGGTRTADTYACANNPSSLTITNLGGMQNFATSYGDFLPYMKVHKYLTVFTPSGFTGPGMLSYLSQRPTGCAYNEVVGGIDLSPENPCNLGMMTHGHIENIGYYLFGNSPYFTPDGEYVARQIYLSGIYDGHCELNPGQMNVTVNGLSPNAQNLYNINTGGGLAGYYKTKVFGEYIYFEDIDGNKIDIMGGCGVISNQTLDHYLLGRVIKSYNYRDNIPDDITTSGLYQFFGLELPSGCGAIRGVTIQTCGENYKKFFDTGIHHVFHGFLDTYTDVYDYSAENPSYNETRFEDVAMTDSEGLSVSKVKNSIVSVVDKNTKRVVHSHYPKFDRINKSKIDYIGLPNLIYKGSRFTEANIARTDIFQSGNRFFYEEPYSGVVGTQPIYTQYPRWNGTTYLVFRNQTDTSIELFGDDPATPLDDSNVWFTVPNSEVRFVDVQVGTIPLSGEIYTEHFPDNTVPNNIFERQPERDKIYDFTLTDSGIFGFSQTAYLPAPFVTDNLKVTTKVNSKKLGDIKTGRQVVGEDYVWYSTLAQYLPESVNTNSIVLASGSDFIKSYNPIQNGFSTDSYENSVYFGGASSTNRIHTYNYRVSDMLGVKFYRRTMECIPDTGHFIGYTDDGYGGFNVGDILSVAKKVPLNSLVHIEAGFDSRLRASGYCDLLYIVENGTGSLSYGQSGITQEETGIRIIDSGNYRLYHNSTASGIADDLTNLFGFDVIGTGGPIGEQPIYLYTNYRLPSTIVDYNLGDYYPYSMNHFNLIAVEDGSMIDVDLASCGKLNLNTIEWGVNHGNNLIVSTGLMLTPDRVGDIVDLKAKEKYLYVTGNVIKKYKYNTIVNDPSGYSISGCLGPASGCEEEQRLYRDNSYLYPESGFEFPANPYDINSLNSDIKCGVQSFIVWDSGTYVESGYISEQVPAISVLHG